VEAQVENTTQAKPQSIVEQLLEIAKTHDAMDVIGGSTSWRWQEGLITRMPKTKTVAAILTKAFKSDDPKVWLGETKDDLKRFIITAFQIPNLKVGSIKVSNIYEALIIMSVTDGRGSSFDDLVYKSAVLKYACLYKDEDEHFINIDNTYVVQMHEKWATGLVENLIRKFNIPQNEEGLYYLGDGHSFSDEDFLRYRHEISLLRHRFVGNNSTVDMWRDFYIQLSDDDMINIEYKLLEYYKELVTNVQDKYKANEYIGKRTTLRYFSLSSITLPSKGGLQ